MRKSKELMGERQCGQANWGWDGGFIGWHTHYAFTNVSCRRMLFCKIKSIYIYILIQSLPSSNGQLLHFRDTCNIFQAKVLTYMDPNVEDEVFLNEVVEVEKIE